MDYELKFDDLMEKAKSGDDVAKNLIGVMYRNGNQVEPNKEEAYKWFKESAEAGNMYAQYNLGSMYEDDGNAEDALNAYKRAASGGLDVAIFKCVELINAKFGPESAFHFTKKLADKDFEEAQFRTGSFYYLGIGVKKDYDEAMDYFIKAANNGSMRGLEMATVCTYYGYGTDKDIKLATTYAKEVLEVYFEDEEESLLPEFESVCKLLELKTER